MDEPTTKEGLQLPDDLAEDVRKQIEDAYKGLEDEKDALTKERDELKAKVEKTDEPKPGEPAPEDAVAKALADPNTPFLVKSAIQRQQDELKEARELILKADEERAVEKAVTEARVWKHLPLKPEEFGPILRKVDAASAEAGQELRRVLTSVDAVAVEAMREIGKGGPGEDTEALGKLHEVAKAIRKEHPELTPAQANARALDTPEGRAAYAESRREEQEEGRR